MAHWIILVRDIDEIRWNYIGQVEAVSPDGTVGEHVRQIRTKHGDGPADRALGRIQEYDEVKITEIAQDENGDPNSYREYELWDGE